MEETLGKRIAANRKRLGITQDRLAEQLGVTPQAVSKWENDQSCPDIAMLPRLAAIFGISVDALLGVAQPLEAHVHEAEIVNEDTEENDDKNRWEVTWNAGRSGNVALSIWIILTSVGMFAAKYLQLDLSLWDLLWTNGLIVLGLYQSFREFSFLYLGCALFGAYSLADKLELFPSVMSRDLLLPACLLLFGLSLLVDALRKPKKPEFVVKRNGKISSKKVSSCNIREDSFDCEFIFCDKEQLIDLPLLREGDAEVRFGELTLDLSGCREFAPSCWIDAECSFGELTILVPRHIRANIVRDTAFGAIDVVGECDPDAAGTLNIDAEVQFGQITVQYI